MNTKTIQHLNKLRLAAVPLQLDNDFIPLAPLPPKSVTQSLWQRLIIIVEPYESEMITREIREAAAERREGYVVNPAYSWYSAFNCPSGIPWAPTRRQWELARLEIQAAINADNARRLAEYEAYRIACEQGVAVPPAD